MLPSVILGQAVQAVEPCRWGFTNHTSLVTLASGQRVIVQQLSDTTQAATLVRLTRDLPALLAPARIALPHLLDFELHTTPPLLIRSYIAGISANSMLETTQSAQSLAHQMGTILNQLHTLPLPDWLDAAWAHPIRLATAAQEWLSLVAEHLTQEQIQRLTLVIASLDTDWPLQSVIAHGDFCPVNAIAENNQIVGLVDVEWARVATPAFDAAWWGWVVRYHHPERWQETWAILLEAAGLPDTPAMQRHIQSIQQLRCLELLADAVQGGRKQAAAMWAERSVETLKR